MYKNMPRIPAPARRDSFSPLRQCSYAGNHGSELFFPFDVLCHRILRCCDSFSGSAQEFVETCMLGGFLKNDEFGLGDRHALGLEQQIAEILIATASSKEGFDVAVDGFHHSEAYFGA